MPKYIIRKGRKLYEVTMTYDEFDEAKAAGVEFVPDPGSAPVAIFTGSGFTRRTTDSRSNRGIDHYDWRMSENWPGPVEKEVKRAKITNWTPEQFRKGAI